MNFENKIGAVGFTTRIAPFLYPITLVKVDPATNDIVRDADGVCVLAKPGIVLYFIDSVDIVFTLMHDIQSQYN